MVKVFLIPSDPRWCVYLDEKNVPTGDVGHICKGFKHTTSVETMFNLGATTVWWKTKCAECEENLPDDMDPTLRFITL